MSSKTNDDRKSIVVVGGGSAGTNIARALSTKFDAHAYQLTMINPRPYRIALPAALRMILSEVDNLDNTSGALIPYDKLFVNGNGRYVQGSVQSIKQKSGDTKGVLSLDNGEEVHYDVLALVPGSTWESILNFPEAPEELPNHIAKIRHDFVGAKSIIIAGGGAVGYELAGELKDIWPEKNVTIVQGDRLLLNEVYPDKFRHAMARAIEARGVTIITEDFVDIDVPNDGSVVTRSGKTLTADILVKTTGPRPNTGFIKSLGPDVLNDSGYIKVNFYLQLEKYPNIFSAGDAMDWKEQKQAAKSGPQGQLVAGNILNYLEGRPMKVYKTGIEMIAISNGKTGGLSYFDVLWGIIFGAWFTRPLKSKALLVPTFRKDAGLTG